MGEFNTDVEPLRFARAATGFVGSTLTPMGAAYMAYVIANRGRAEALHILGTQAPTANQHGDVRGSDPTRNGRSDAAHDGGNRAQGHEFLRIS